MSDNAVMALFIVVKGIVVTILWVGTAYLVGWQGWSPWWFVLTLLLSGGTFSMSSDKKEAKAEDALDLQRERYITTWRKTGEHVLDWDHHVSDSEEEVEKVIKNITAQGVHQYHTWKLGEFQKDRSSAY